MPKKIQLSIPEPCHEDWNAMTPVEKGKFCSSCQKQVVDFSKMSDRQLAEFFKKPSTGSVCGRFMTDQLDRDIEIPGKRIPWLKYFFTIALPAFFLSLKVSASKKQGEIKLRKAITTDTGRNNIYDDVRILGMVTRPQVIRPFIGDTVVAPVEKPDDKKNAGAVCEKLNRDSSDEIFLAGEVVEVARINKKTVNGYIVNERGEPVPFANIELERKKIIMADEEGRFEIPKKLMGKNDELIISSAGYETRVVSKKDEDFKSGKLVIVLKDLPALPAVTLLSGGYILGKYSTGKTSQYLEGRVGGISVVRSWVKISGNEPAIKLPDNSVRVYPNPVKKGTNLTIEWKLKEEGYFQLQLINPSGQTVQQQQLWIDAEARVISFDIPAMPAGTYFLVLTNKKTGKKMTEKIVVQ